MPETLDDGRRYDGPENTFLSPEQRLPGMIFPGGHYVAMPDLSCDDLLAIAPEGSNLRRLIDENPVRSHSQALRAFFSREEVDDLTPDELVRYPAQLPTAKALEAIADFRYQSPCFDGISRARTPLSLVFHRMYKIAPGSGLVENWSPKILISHGTSHLPRPIPIHATPAGIVDVHSSFFHHSDEITEEIIYFITQQAQRMPLPRSEHALILELPDFPFDRSPGLVKSIETVLNLTPDRPHIEVQPLSLATALQCALQRSSSGIDSHQMEAFFTTEKGPHNGHIVVFCRDGSAVAFREFPEPGAIAELEKKVERKIPVTSVVLQKRLLKTAM